MKYGLVCCALVLTIAVSAWPADTPSRAPWYEGPQLFVMTGFIANTTGGTWGADFINVGPWSREKQLADLARWNKGLGRAYDPDKVAQSFKKAGATGVIFYDKWHDGLVPHKTKHTNYMTERDLVGDTIRALRKHGLKIVVYYSVGLDANPEPKFKEWTCRDASGKPMGLCFPEDWKSFHSPYRQYVIDHLVEILQKHGPVHGLWLDLYTQPVPLSRDVFTAKAFEAAYGKAVEEATPEESAEFNIRTLGGFLKDIRQSVTAVQPDVVLTFNGAGRADGQYPKRVRDVDDQSDWLSIEGHSRDRIDSIATVGQNWNRPFETGILLNTSWYVPMGDQAPRASMSEEEAIVSAAAVFARGGNVYGAMTPGHSGVFDDDGDLRLLRAAGGWLKANREFIQGAETFAEVGVLRGDPAPSLLEVPALNSLWHFRYRSARPPADAPGTDTDLALRAAGYVTQLTGSLMAKRPVDLAAYRLVVLPENAPLSEALAGKIRDYVRSGGSVLAFGHASLLDENAKRRGDFALGDVFGVSLAGDLPGYKTLRVTADSGLISGILGNPAALAVKATTGQALATWDLAGDTPAIVENTFGKGRAIYISAAETAISKAADMLEELTARLIGPPAIRVKGQRDYSLIVNRKGDDLLVYLMNNTTGSRTNLRGSTASAVRPSALVTTPEEVEVTIDTAALGDISNAELIPSRNGVGVSRRPGTARMYLRASPSVTSLRLTMNRPSR